MKFMRYLLFLLSLLICGGIGYAVYQQSIQDEGEEKEKKGENEGEMEKEFKHLYEEIVTGKPGGFPTVLAWIREFERITDERKQWVYTATGPATP